MENEPHGTKHSDYLSEIKNTLELYLVKKAPFALPTGLKEFIVRFGPWIDLILVILFLPALFAVIGFSTIVMPFAYQSTLGYGFGSGYYLQLLLSGITFILQIIALPGLFKRSIGAWNLIFYSILVGAVANLLSGNIMSLIIGTLISLYILFQIKSYYK